MGSDGSEKRKELRIAIEGTATVTANHNGRSMPATTVDMTSAGVLLRFAEANQFATGDLVTCDFFVLRDDDSLLPYWGVGTICRVDGCDVAIALDATGLCELKSETAEPHPTSKE
jgi:hypothetical protein